MSPDKIPFWIDLLLPHPGAEGGRRSIRGLDKVINIILSGLLSASRISATLSAWWESQGFRARSRSRSRARAQLAAGSRARDYVYFNVHDLHGG